MILLGFVEPDSCSCLLDLRCSHQWLLFMWIRIGGCRKSKGELERAAWDTLNDIPQPDRQTKVSTVADFFCAGDAISAFPIERQHDISPAAQQHFQNEPRQTPVSLRRACGKEMLDSIIFNMIDIVASFTCLPCPVLCNTSYNVIWNSLEPFCQSA